MGFDNPYFCITYEAAAHHGLSLPDLKHPGHWRWYVPNDPVVFYSSWDIPLVPEPLEVIEARVDPGRFLIQFDSEADFMRLTAKRE